jgi:hypothetical protein
MAAEIHVGDAGTAIRVHLVDQDKKDFDVSGASLLQLTLLSPAKRRLVVLALPATDGKDGRVQYVLADGDLDTAGTWKLQAQVRIGSGSWNSNVVPLPVVSNL